MSHENPTSQKKTGAQLLLEALRDQEVSSEPLLAGNLVKIAEPAVKWAQEISNPNDVPVLIRRAFQDSAAMPTGPVFLSLPIDVMTSEAQVPTTDRSRIVQETISAGLVELADALAAIPPGRLAIIAGDEITRSDAVVETTKIADLLGAKVLGPSWPLFMSFPTDHVLWAGNLPSSASQINSVLTRFDAV